MENQNLQKIDLINSIEESLTFTDNLSNDTVKSVFLQFFSFILKKVRFAETCSNEELKRLIFANIKTHLQTELLKIQQKNAPYHEEMDCIIAGSQINEVLVKIPSAGQSESSRIYHLQEQALRVEQDILHGSLYHESFNQFLTKIKMLTSNSSFYHQPSVYIKFEKSQVNKGYEKWTDPFIQKWINDLRQAGVVVSVNESMTNERMHIENNKFVIVVGTESFAQAHAVDTALQHIINKHNHILSQTLERSHLGALFYNPILLLVLSGTYKSAFPPFFYSQLPNETFSNIANFNQSGYLKHFQDLLTYLYRVPNDDDRWNALWNEFTESDKLLRHLVNGISENVIITHLDEERRIEEEEKQKFNQALGNILGSMRKTDTLDTSNLAQRSEQAQGQRKAIESSPLLQSVKTQARGLEKEQELAYTPFKITDEMRSALRGPDISYRMRSLQERRSYLIDVNSLNYTDDDEFCYWGFVQDSTNFVGREKELKLIEQKFNQASVSVSIITQSVIGVGGIGKTALAEAYAQRHMTEYALMACLRSVLDFKEELKDLALLLDVEFETETSFEQVLVRTFKRINERYSNKKILFILDDAKSPSEIDVFLKHATKIKNFNIIVTSRSPHWDKQKIEKGIRKELIALNNFSEEDAIEYINHRLIKPLEEEHNDEDDFRIKQMLFEKKKDFKKNAKRLAETLKYYPLALAQATAFIKRVGNIEDYLDAFTRNEETKRNLLSESFSVNDDLGKTVLLTFLLSFEQAEKQKPDAAKLIKICAFLSEREIPKELLRECMENIFPLEAIMYLTNYSLITNINETYYMHEMVQMVARCLMSEDERITIIKKLVDIFKSSFNVKVQDATKWAYWEGIYPHVETVLQRNECKSVDKEKRAKLYYKISVLMHEKGDFEKAHDAIKEALKLTTDTPRLVKYKLIEAQLLKGEGELEKALTITNEIKLLIEKNDSNIYWLKYKIECFIITSEILFFKGSYREIQENINEIIPLLEKTSDNELSYQKIRTYLILSEFFRTILNFEKSKNYLNLAELLNEKHNFDSLKIALYEEKSRLAYAQNDYIVAEKLILEKIERIRMIFGNSTLDITMNLNGDLKVSPNLKSIQGLTRLAEIYSAQRLYNKAEICLSAASEIIKILYNDNDNTAQALVLTDQGLIYQARGDYERAKFFIQSGLEMACRIYTGHTREISVRLSLLGDLLQSDKKYKEAIECYLKAIKIQEELDLGQYDNEKKGYYVSVMECFFYLKEKEEALQYFEKVKNIIQYSENADDEYIHLCLRVFFIFLNQFSKTESPEVYFLKAKEIFDKKTLHKWSFNILYHYGVALYSMKDYSQAKEILSQAYNILLTKQFSNKYLISSLADCCMRLEQYDEALKFYLISWKTYQKEIQEGVVDKNINQVIKNIADCFFKKKSYKEILELYQNVHLNLEDYFLKINPIHFVLQLREFAKILVKENEYTEAEKFYELALNHYKSNENLMKDFPGVGLFLYESLYECNEKKSPPVELLEEIKKQASEFFKKIDHINDSFVKANINLQIFALELGFEELNFDENNTCILSIHDQLSLHLTYEPNSKRLYLYSPLLDGLPSSKKDRLKLYEKLLEGSMLGGQMAGGGVGVALKDELILIHNFIDMEHAVPNSLKKLAGLYIETVDKWCAICKNPLSAPVPTKDKKSFSTSSFDNIYAFIEDADDPFENAKNNLTYFGSELKLNGLNFDINNTCILGIDDAFSLHITYEPNSKQLYLYSPLLDGFPKNPSKLLKLYEKLLQGSMLGGQMSGGGVGIAVREEMILMHCTLNMKNALFEKLSKFAPLYVETIEKWKKTVNEIVSAAEDDEETADQVFRIDTSSSQKPITPEPTKIQELMPEEMLIFDGYAALESADYVKAESCFLSALEKYQTTYGATDKNVIMCLSNLVECYQKMQLHEKALSYCVQLIESVAEINDAKGLEKAMELLAISENENNQAKTLLDGGIAGPSSQAAAAHPA